ncbi:dihydropteroate synthase [Castellaniella defragrans]|uniref:dihydropteroate synthase n=1 Tax=Castellaniella defragrans TaxID=75697 RepID=UPI0012442C78|nr:dihydropteroate synthase [Castellaniella defragrans]KAB0623806.1 dihydropteroate synthase [Castellaniella defragrans]
MHDHLQCGRFRLSLERPLVMGIVNVTPDSFSDGNAHFRADEAIAHGRLLVEEGADLLDIGGESTRPGAQAVPADEELRRILPVIEALRDCGVPLSVDTCKPSVMRAALEAGADMINDIGGFAAPGAVEAVADADCALCLMHMRGEPRTMQDAPSYQDVVTEVRAYLDQGARRLRQAGIAADRIVLDPGFGFGKTAAHNYTLLRQLPQAVGQDYPSLLGLSRKSMIGAVTGRPASRRLGGSVAAALAGAVRGAHILRVHDVADTVDALRVWSAVERGVRA